MGMVGDMKTPHWLVAVFAAVLFGSTGFQTASAQLPSLNEQPWIGHFIGYEAKRVRIGVTALGKITIHALNNKGEMIDMHHPVVVAFGIEETLPSGKTQMKNIIAESLETTDAATDKLEKVTIRGKVTGDAAFETTIEEQRGYFLIGGRVTDPGSLKNPLRFVVTAKFPSMYEKVKKETKKQISAYEKKTKNDGIQMKWTDGQRQKADLSDSVDASSPEINGPGISEIELEVGAYPDREFVFNASPNSSMRLSNNGSGPLHEGFTITWAAEPGKDPDGKARIAFDVK